MKLRLSRLFGRWPPSARKWSVRVAVAFALYSLAGFFLAPALIKWQMLKQLPDLTKRQAAVREVKVNPWALSLTIRGLALTEPEGRPFCSWEELFVDFQASSLFHWAWTFKEIRLVQPVGELILLQNGRLNIANMLAPATNAPPANPPAAERPVPRINIFQLQITNGFVAFEDRARRKPFRTEYRPINLELHQFTTRPDANAPYSFRAEGDASTSLAWAGDVTVQPLQSAGNLEIRGIRLSRYQPYLDDFTRAQLTNGVVNLRLSYRFASGTNGIDCTITNAAVHLAQLQLVDPDTGEIVVGIGSLQMARTQLDLRRRWVEVGEVRILEAGVLTRLAKGGRVNLLGLLQPPAPAQPQASVAPAPGSAAAPSGAEPWTVSVLDFALERSTATFEDQTRRTSFRTEIRPIELHVKQFTTRPDADASYSLLLGTESGETLVGGGTVSINPVRSRGNVAVDDLDLKKYLPYAEDHFQGRLQGKLMVKAPYSIALSGKDVSASLSNAIVKLTDMEVRLSDSEEPLTRVPELSLEGVSASLAERRARVGLMKTTGGSIHVERRQGGKLNVQGLLAVPAPPVHQSVATPAPETATPGSPWVVNVDEVALDNYAVRFDDLQPTKPAAFTLDQIAVNVKGLSTDLTNAKVAVRLSTRLNQTGTFKVDGTGRLAPVTADLTIGLAGFDLPPLQPYVDPFAHVGIVSGAFSLDGRARYQASPESGTPPLAFNGNMRLARFKLTDGAEECVRWDDLALSGIDFQPDRLKIENIQWTAPGAALRVRPDRKLNVAEIVRRPPASTNDAVTGASTTAVASGTNAAAAKAVSIEVGTLALKQAAASFTDESISPHVAISLEELTGTIQGLSSALNSTATVELAGRVDRQSPISISGRVNPLASALFVDLVLSNANTQLTPLTPYLEKYAGHPLNKGRLTTQLKYHIEGKQLQAEHKVQIDQLALGPRNTSPDATSLPVKLGVALLKDSNGQIQLDVPVTGRLDDPQFRVGPIILQVVVNLLTKAATSPFKLLGALVGGGEELSYIAFMPGSTNLVEGEVEKLSKLTKALNQRPALNLEIEGSVDPVADRLALGRQKLEERLKAQRLKELAAKGKEPPPRETFQVEAEDYQRLLRAAFAEQFGTNISAILRTNLGLAASTNAAAAKPQPKRGLASIGIGGRGSSQAEKQLSRSERQALDQCTPEMMQTLLASTIPVSTDDERALMDARAQWVQAWLIQNGPVAADRLMLVAPKPIDPARPGQSRVNLSLN